MNRFDKMFMKLSIGFLIVAFTFTVTFPLTATETNTQTPPQANCMKPDHLPTPFNADEIREGCPAGRMIKFRMESPGKPVSFQVFDFKEGTAETANFDAYMLDAEGKLMGKKQAASVKWTELQAHGSYPKATTTVIRETKTTDAGDFDCWLYTVTEKKEGKTHIGRYWFAVSLPGPPVLVTQTLEGKEVFKMTALRVKK